MKISILQDSTNGIAVYSESHNTTTTVYGLVKLAIGSGTILTGDFDTIHWGNTDHFVKIEIDTTGGNNYFDTSATNELQEFSVSGDTLFLSNGNYVILPGVDPVILASSPFFCGDSLLDTRDGQKYATVLIGTQCWMAQNINIGTRIDGIVKQTNNTLIEKYCYNNKEDSCDVYGGLYQWNEMMQYVLDTGAQGICPNGWHIPSDEEWKILEGTVDSQYGVEDPEWEGLHWRGFDAGYHLKSTTGWNENGNGDDFYGFAGLPGGGRDYGGGFSDLGGYAYFWSSTKCTISTAWGRTLIYYNGDGVRRYYIYETDGV